MNASRHLQCTDHALSLKVQSLKGILVGLCGLTTRLSTSLNALISLIAIIEMTHDSGSRSASQDALSLRLCLPGIRCFDRLKTLWRPEQHRRETKISSPLPLSTNESDQYYGSSDHEPLRHAVGPGFQVMSDLHLEGGTAESANSYEQFKIPPKAPYLRYPCRRHWLLQAQRSLSSISAATMRMLRSRFLDTWQPRLLWHVASRRAQSWL